MTVNALKCYEAITHSFSSVPFSLILCYTVFSCY